MKKTLSCPPFGDLPVEWDGEALGGAAALALIVKLVEDLWPQSWPSIHAAVVEVVREYEHEEHFESASKSLAICPPALHADAEAEWTVAVRTEPFAGVYELDMQGSKVSHAGVTF